MNDKKSQISFSEIKSFVFGATFLRWVVVTIIGVITPFLFIAKSLDVFKEKYVGYLLNLENISYLEAFYFYIGTWLVIVVYILLSLLIIRYGIKKINKTVLCESNNMKSYFQEKIDEIVSSNKNNLEIIRDEFKRKYLLKIQSSIKSLELSNKKYFLAREYFQEMELNYSENIKLKKNEDVVSDVKIYVLSRDIKVAGVKSGFLDIVAKNIINHKIRYRYITRIDVGNRENIKMTVLNLRTKTCQVDINSDPVKFERNSGNELVTFTLVHDENYNFLFDFVIFSYKLNSIPCIDAFQELRADTDPKSKDRDSSWVKLNKNATESVFMKINKMRANANSDIGNFSIFSKDEESFKNSIDKIFDSERYWKPK